MPKYCCGTTGFEKQPESCWHPFNQLEQTPEICLMSSLHFVQSLRIMALTVFNASCLAKWPCCGVDDDDTKACCDEGDDVVIASGSKASEGCVNRLAWAI